MSAPRIPHPDMSLLRVCVLRFVWTSHSTHLRNRRITENGNRHRSHDHPRPPISPLRQSTCRVVSTNSNHHPRSFHQTNLPPRMKPLQRRVTVANPKAVVFVSLSLTSMKTTRKPRIAHSTLLRPRTVLRVTLPRGTRPLPDLYHRCPPCRRERPTWAFPAHRLQGRVVR